jgi:cytochrome c
MMRLALAALLLAAAPGLVQAQEAESAFAPAVAAADPAKGETFAKRCAACHTFDSGGANKVGPNLWNVVNRPIASVPDYNYSEAMTGFSEGGTKTWTYDLLSAYLADPKGTVPGNKMVFPGIKKDEDRANVIAYLRTLSESPAPLPGS